MATRALINLPGNTTVSIQNQGEPTTILPLFADMISSPSTFTIETLTTKLAGARPKVNPEKRNLKPGDWEYTLTGKGVLTVRSLPPQEYSKTRMSPHDYVDHLPKKRQTTARISITDAVRKLHDHRIRIKYN